MFSTSYSFELLTISGGGEIIYRRIEGSGETGSRSGTWKTGCIFIDEGSLRQTADLDITCSISKGLSLRQSSFSEGRVVRIFLRSNHTFCPDVYAGARSLERL